MLDIIETETERHGGRERDKKKVRYIKKVFIENSTGIKNYPVSVKEAIR